MLKKTARSADGIAGCSIEQHGCSVIEATLSGVLTLRSYSEMRLHIRSATDDASVKIIRLDTAVVCFAGEELRCMRPAPGSLRRSGAMDPIAVLIVQPSQLVGFNDYAERMLSLGFPIVVFSVADLAVARLFAAVHGTRARHQEWPC